MTVRYILATSLQLSACILGIVIAAQAAVGDNDQMRVAKRGDIRVDTNLVLIPVSVTDSANHPIVGIDARQFRVFDGKVPQEVVNVSTDDTPVSVGIVFDGSASMERKLPQARAAVVEFLKSANPDDEFFLVNFSTSAEVAVPFTTSGPEIQHRLMYATNKGKTALLDAIHLALDTMKDARNPRKALLIISDGGDNDSRYTKLEVRQALRETDIWVYAIGVYDSQSVTLPEEERGGPTLLSELAEQTGGRHFAVFKANELPDAAAKIGMELRNQYLVGVRPSNVESNGKFHKLQVKLVDSGSVQVSFRPGYYAPLDRPTARALTVEER
jgi:Ca-activated chloride channel homolog